MIIELKWLDPNKTKYHSTEIYRADYEFDNIEDAELIATVGPGITSYQDTTVEHKKTYYYRFRLIYGSQKFEASDMFTFTAIPYTGPGPAIFQFGDERFGYFGKFPMDLPSLPSFNMVREAFSLGPITGNYLEVAELHKFAIGGTVRGTFPYPLAIGSELPRDSEIMQTLINGGAIPLTIGLHDWKIIIPSAEHHNNPNHNVQHFPGELRSMMAVITEMYARVEDAETGNKTGGRLTLNSGLNMFYDPLSARFPDTEIKYIISSDWTDNECTAINWTSRDAVYPLRAKELHTEVVNVATDDVWNKMLIWPILVYTGLTKPKEV
ncbi:hypothetical protein [Pseudomonas aeruginosa]|uniref:hypothetical protein n=2 Tax=Pseudomonas aeruginosa TaxID=287 RepID=UPI001CA4B920|nr:hypothetical protein [Pseudomonas aeruginosa]MBW6071098.1 hypothetical protein [Pseudomonas aeruginosa]QYV98814.1 hypothetical protein [Pseudomonas phage T2P]QYV99153.1 hypothetical protein [Pseudomonas phage U1B]QYV99608.1 hypothetical protein [Pseudomonas phage U5]